MAANCSANNTRGEGSKCCGQCCNDTAIVYMTKEISPETILRLYNALGREA